MSKQPASAQAPSRRSALGRLQSDVLRPEVVEYTLARFEEELTKIADFRNVNAGALERRRAAIEKQISNCTNAIADGQPSRFLIAKLAELERELNDVVRMIDGARPAVVRSKSRDTRKSVEERLRDLRRLMNAEPQVPRAAIGKHVEKIILTPEGRAYIASGEGICLAVMVWLLPRCRGTGMHGIAKS